MSLQEQERALFDLLFDRDLRVQFRENPTEALGGYTLNRAERADFDTIRVPALERDARMRVFMLLAQLCQELPVSFALASSVAGAGAQLRQLVDRELMDVPVALRAAEFGNRLMDWMQFDAEPPTDLQPQMLALIGAETAMARSAGSLRQLQSAAQESGPAPTALPAEWTTLPASIADHACAVIVPQSLSEVQRALCPVDTEDLWRHLDGHPVTEAQVRTALLSEEPRLLLVRHTLTHTQRCMPLLSRQQVEVSSGFAPLLRYLDGRNRIHDILEQLQQAGAPQSMVPAILQGFEQLVGAGIVRLHGLP